VNRKTEGRKLGEVVVPLLVPPLAAREREAVSPKCPCSRFALRAATGETRRDRPLALPERALFSHQPDSFKRELLERTVVQMR